MDYDTWKLDNGEKFCGPFTLSRTDAEKSCNEQILSINLNFDMVRYEILAESLTDENYRDFDDMSNSDIEDLYFELYDERIVIE